MPKLYLLALLPALLLTSPAVFANSGSLDEAQRTVFTARENSPNYAEELGAVLQAATTCGIAPAKTNGASTLFNELLRLGGDKHKAALSAWFEHGAKLAQKNNVPGLCSFIETDLRDKDPRMLSSAKQLSAAIATVEASGPKETWVHGTEIFMPLPK